MALSEIKEVRNVINALEDIEEQTKFFELVSETEIPTTLKGALREGWELAAKGVAIEWLLAYRPSQRHLDNQRIISLETALMIISEWEEKLIVDHVLDPLDVAWKVLGVVPRVFVAVWQNTDTIWKLLKLLFDIATSFDLKKLNQAWDIVLGGFGAVLGIIGTALSTKLFQGVCLSILKDRDRVAAKMRQRAFPQGRGRVRRRKVARL